MLKDIIDITHFINPSEILYKPVLGQVLKKKDRLKIKQ